MRDKFYDIERVHSAHCVRQLSQEGIYIHEPVRHGAKCDCFKGQSREILTWIELMFRPKPILGGHMSDSSTARYDFLYNTPLPFGRELQGNVKHTVKHIAYVRSAKSRHKDAI